MTTAFVKTHAYGNDFLLVTAAAIGDRSDRAGLARFVCNRHRGFGADGLLIYEPTSDGATSELFNADGSRSELSGNGVRCLATWLAISRGLPPGLVVNIGTGAGSKPLQLLERQGGRCRFRAAMGLPRDLRQERIDVRGEPVDAIVLRVGNPQCVVLGDVTEQRLTTIAAGLAVHPFFPEGTNVELATVETPDRVRILIWERGVGPTEASGTGACAAAVAAAAFAGAQRVVDVVSPGGVQRVEWTDAELYLTGWAELVGTANLDTWTAPGN